MEENGLDLRHTLAMLWHERYLILGFTIAVSFSAFLYSAAAPETYTASSRVLIQPISAEGTDGGLSAALDPAVDTSIETQAAIMGSGAVATRVSTALPSIDPSRYSVEASPLTDNVVQVRVSSGDPRIAAKVADAYVEEYLSLRSDTVQRAFGRLAQNLEIRIQDLNQRILTIDAELATPEPTIGGLPDSVLRAERDDLVTTVGSLNARKVEFQSAADRALAGGGGQIVQRAAAPSSPSSPHPIRDAWIGLVLGVILGVGFCFFKEHLGRRVYTREDAVRAARAPVLASLPGMGHRPSLLDALLDARWWRPRPDASGASPRRGSLVDERVYEASRVLRAALTAHGLGGSVRRLAVLSAEPHQGEVPTLVGLGVASASAGMRTIIVAADIKDREVDALFGAEHAPGLTDILMSDAGVREPVRAVLGKTPVEDLMLLPAGTADHGTRDPLASPKLELVLKEFNRSAAVVLIASAPLSEGADATILAGHADAAVLVVRMRSARASAVRHAAEMLGDLEVPLLGIILQDAGRLDEPSRAAWPRSREPIGEGADRSAAAAHTVDQLAEPEPPATDGRPGSGPDAQESGSKVRNGGPFEAVQELEENGSELRQAERPRRARVPRDGSRAGSGAEHHQPRESRAN